MAENNRLQQIPALAAQAVLVPSIGVDDDDAVSVCGYDFNRGINYNDLFASYARTGFQASSLAAAITEINRMRFWRLSHEPIHENEDDDYKSQKVREQVRTTIFLSYTSNLVSSGLREVIRYLVQHKMVDVLVTTAGGVEEDIIKCLAPTYLGDFSLKGETLRKRGLNRIGNLLVPNSNYCAFEDWINPILDLMVAEQETKGALWTPSKLIRLLGEKINNEESIYYWAYKNNIPVFSPAITDGSIGDMIYFHTYRNPGLKMDIVSDIRAINDIALRAKKTGMIILGGGLVKHHVCNANLMRNGADFSVFINTAQEFDGSDAGAKPDEAISWGKIKADAEPVKVCADATIVFPLIVAQTFAADCQH